MSTSTDRTLSYNATTEELIDTSRNNEVVQKVGTPDPATRKFIMPTSKLGVVDSDYALSQLNSVRQKLTKIGETRTSLQAAIDRLPAEETNLRELEKFWQAQVNKF